MKKTTFTATLQDQELRVNRIISKDQLEISRSNELYNLQEVSEDQLLDLRLSGEPGFVLKTGTKFYYSPIPGDLNVMSFKNLGEHLCTNWHHTCKNFCTFGCQKVHDAEVSWYRFHGYNAKRSMVLSKRIEKYEFIEVGYEAFNLYENNCLVILKCNHFA